MMPKITPKFIYTLDEMRSFVDTLSSVPIVAVDTESNSLYAYQEQVCLVQFSTPQADYILDPLSLGTEAMVLLAPIFSNPAIEKVFHAAEYDLIVLSRDFGFSFSNLFDTMWAACIVGQEEVGLGALLQHQFNVKLDKKFQRSDWGRRPLPQEWLIYAACDTHYLIALRDHLKVELEKINRWDLAQEDFSRFAKINAYREHPVDSQTTAKINASQVAANHNLNRKQAAVLQELFVYRDRCAQQRNVPPFKILPDQILIAVAKNSPQNSSELQSISMLSVRVLQRHSDGLLHAVKRGLRTPYYHPPSSDTNHNSEYGFPTRFEALRLWRKSVADKMGVKSDVVLPRDLLEDLARKNPQSLEGVDLTLANVPWRRSHYASAILKVLQSYPAGSHP